MPERGYEVLPLTEVRDGDYLWLTSTELLEIQKVETDFAGMIRFVYRTDDPTLPSASTWMNPLGKTTIVRKENVNA